MPAYSFQERFVSFILDGSKFHTVRKGRDPTGRGRHAAPGDKLYLYTGMRTKGCRKVGEAVCEAVMQIYITEEGILPQETYSGDIIPLSAEQREVFAWSDGFRPLGTTIDRPAGAWEMMKRWFRQTNGLPFKGVVIYWKDFISFEDGIQQKIRQVQGKIKDDPRVKWRGNVQ